MNHWVEIKQTDKKEYKLTSITLNGLLEKSKKLEKKPLLKLLIDRNDKEMFEVTCEIKILKK